MKKRKILNIIIIHFIVEYKEKRCLFDKILSFKNTKFLDLVVQEM